MEEFFFFRAQCSFKLGHFTFFNVSIFFSFFCTGSSFPSVISGT